MQTVPIGLKPTFICLKVARVMCFQCERSRQVKVPFPDPRRTYTHTFERYARGVAAGARPVPTLYRNLSLLLDVVAARPR